MQLYEDISIVVQGPNYNEDGNTSAQVLRSYRKFFPNAEIIFSSWEGAIDAKAPFLKELNIVLVLSKDPGPDNAGSVTFNVNRQIVSSLAGIKKATRTYLLKTRSDAILRHNLFLHYYRCHVEARPRGCVFSQPVMIYALSTRNWTKGLIPHLFHPCDWIFMGRREDILDLFDIPLMGKEDLHYFQNRRQPRTPSFSGWSRYTPEQWIFVSFLVKKGVLTYDAFPHYCYHDKKTLALNEKLFTEDLLVLDNDQIGVYSWKYPFPHCRDIQISQLRHAEWVELCHQSHMPFAKAPWLYRKMWLSLAWLNAMLGLAIYYVRTSKLRAAIREAIR